jgi:hypothetical protein
MDEKIIAPFCLCDDLLKALPPRADPQCQRHDADIMPTALSASVGCRGHQESARLRLQQPPSIPHRGSTRRWRRRLHRMQELLTGLCQR